MPKPYTIRLFIPEGTPDTLKVINKMNWTGTGLEITREAWDNNKDRPELEEAGIYILVGYEEENDRPTIYVGQADTIKNRIEDHRKNKDFWDRALVFVSSNKSLNRAHITWLEWALINRAKDAGRSNLDNSATPKEPNLTESERADTQEFLNEILSILPLVEVRVFEKPKKIKPGTDKPEPEKCVQNTIVVPAQEDGFKNVFIGENCWYAIRIGGGRLTEIKYIAVYQTAPISAVTHYAEVESIEPYGAGGKYKLNFVAPAKPIGPIEYGDAPKGTMQGPKYTTFEKLMSAKKLMDLY